MNERLNDNNDQEVVVERPRGNFWTEIIKFTFITLIIVVPFRLYIAQPFIVSGASMDPTFADGEYLIVDQFSQHVKQPDRDSVIIFRYPKDQSKFFIKRVIGLPDETVEIKDGKVTIFNESHPRPDGLPLKEPFIADKNKKRDDLTVELKKGEYFVLGDNRLGSLDSRSWGPVPEKLIVGRPLLRLLPVNRINFLPGDYSTINK